MSQLSNRGPFGQFSGPAGSAYPDPWLDVASSHMPTNMRSALYWSEFIYNSAGSYRMACDRVLSYFITDIVINNASEDEQEKWESFLNDVLDFKTVLHNMQQGRSCYGNAFASVLVPFKRFLSCTKCGASFILREVYDNPAFHFEWQMPNFVMTCPCKHRGKTRVDDRDEDEETRLKIKIWNPHEIELLHDYYNDDVAYLWRIPEDYKRLVRQGHLYHLERAPLEVIKAIHNNQLYRFHDDEIFHMREQTLAGIVTRGWGLPRVLVNFRQIYYVQVLRRYNEAIALDYVIPFRVITPAPATGKTASGIAIDPMSLYNGSDFRHQVMSMIRRRRRDPAAMQVLPFPVNFQMFGADANQLAPRDLLDQGMETLLNDVGVPVELYAGSVQLQAQPVALRLFEATFQHQVHDSDAFLDWVCNKVGRIMSWEVVDAKMKRVTIADNLENQMMAAQLMMSQQLSGTTVLGQLGYKWKAEQKQIADEAQFQSEVQTRKQEEMQQSGAAQQLAKGQTDPSQGGAPGGAPPPGGAAPGGAPAGGAPPAGGAGGGDPSQGPPPGPVTQYLASVGPNAPQTPEDMMQVADSLAQQLLSGVPESVKDSELRKLKIANEPLHTMVREKMDEIREQTRTAAGNASQGW
jgi:hypothetical protein